MPGLGRIPDSVKEEIRARTDIVGVVEEHVRLKKAGSRYKGLCPFHDEKTPSFHVSPDRNIFHCFGCGKGGDVFRFLMDIRNERFPEVVEDLASRCGVDLSAYQYQGGAGETSLGDRGKFLEALSEAQAYFRESYLRSPRAQGYAQERHLDATTRESFGLAYAPDSWDGLRKRLLSKGFDEAFCIQIGLLKPRKGGQGSYDAFRDRLMFPIRDDHARVIAFGGRRLGEGEGPKYINSPESAHYIKGQHLYNQDRAKQVIPRLEPSQRPLLCEGYMDVVAFHRAGIDYAVANLGTALTPSQARKISRLCSRWVLAYDADEAGLRAAVRAAQLLDPQGVDLRVLVLDGKDPDEVLEAQGSEALLESVDRAIPLDEFLFRALSRNYDLSGPEGRSGAFRELGGIFKNLTNPVLQQGLIRHMADGLDLSEDLIRNALGSAKSTREHQEIFQAPTKKKVPILFEAERNILREILLEASLYFEGPAQVLTPRRATDPYVKHSLRHLEALGIPSGPVHEELLDSLDESLDDQRALASFLRRLLFQEDPAGDDSSAHRIVEWVHHWNVAALQSKQKTIRRELRECRDRQEMRSLTVELSRINKELNQLKEGASGVLPIGGV